MSINALHPAEIALGEPGGRWSAPLRLAQATPPRTLGVNEPQIIQPWGEGVLYQIHTERGSFELRWRANEPGRFVRSDILVFESQRPIELRRDARILSSWPFGDERTPVRRAIDRVYDEAHAASNRISVPQPPSTPMSDNPLVRFYRGAGGAIRGLTGDTVEFLARIAPYLPSGNGTVMPMPLTSDQAQALQHSQQIQRLSSDQAGDAVARFNDTLGFAMGLPPDSPEVQFGRIAIGVAEGIEGLVGMTRGALALVRQGDNLLLSVRNVEILHKLANPTTQQLPRITRWVDGLDARELGALPAEVRQALRRGLAANPDDAAALRALRRLDELGDGVPPPGARPRGADAPGTPPRSLPAALDTPTPPPDPALVRRTRQLEVLANYTGGIDNTIVRQHVGAIARQQIEAGQTVDLAQLARIRREVETALALNTRSQLAGSTFSNPGLQAALRQRLADAAGTDPSRNAALAASPQWLQAQAQDIALDHLDAALFNGSGVPPAVREAWRGSAQAWARQALPENPALALEQLLARSDWQTTLLRDVAVDRIAGFDHAAVTGLLRSDPARGRELALLREHVAGAIDAEFGSASAMKNLLGSGGDRSRARLLRDAVSLQMGGDSPLAAAIQRHAIQQGTGERALVDLLTSPQSRLAFMKEALVQQTLRAPGQRLAAAEQALLRTAIDAELARRPDLASRMQYLKDLSNSGQTLARMVTPPASVRAPEPPPQDPSANPAPRGTDPPSTPPASVPERQLAGGVTQRGNQIVLRGADLEVVLPPGWRFGPIEEFANLRGAGSGYTTISGHGTLLPNALRQAGVPTQVTVPEGTRVVLLTPPGAVLGTRLGEYIDNRTFSVDYGIDQPQIVPIRVPYRVLEPGQTLPNAVVTPPTGLNVPQRADVITVSDEQQARALSQLLRPDMGTVVINICAPVQGAPQTRWSGLQFEEFGVVNSFNLRRAHYGLPAAGDAPPPTDLRNRSSNPPAEPPPPDDDTPPGDQPPPLDTSGWDLTMGDSVFGRLPEPPPALPLPRGLGQPPGTLASRPPVEIIDPITGARLVVDDAGRLRSTEPPLQTTARQLDPGELNLPQREDLGRIGFQRSGPRVSIKVGDYGVVVDLWGQRDPNQVINLSGVYADLRRSGEARPITSSTDLAERVAQTLAERAPAGWGWAVKSVGPNPTVGSTTLGVNLGNYIEFGDLQAALDRGAVLYDPDAPLGSRYRLNTTTNAAGETVMVVPLEITLGWRSAATPTSIPGLPPLPVGVNLSRSSETKTLLSGPINPELLVTLNAGLNNPLGTQLWHDAGTLGVRQVRQINFALPGTLAREGAYTLPSGWTRLENELLTPEQRENRNAWSVFTKITGTVGGSVFGIGGRLGFSTERVERLATDWGPAISQVYDQPPAAGSLARPSSVVPFTFIAGMQGSGGYRLIEILPEDPNALRAQGQYVQPDVRGTLIVLERGQVEMTGSVLNTLNGFVVEASDLPRLAAFLRALDPVGPSGGGNAEVVYEVLRRVRPGQPLGAEGIDLIREAIRRYAETAPR